MVYLENYTQKMDGFHALVINRDLENLDWFNAFQGFCFVKIIQEHKDDY